MNIDAVPIICNGSTARYIIQPKSFLITKQYETRKLDIAKNNTNVPGKVVLFFNKKPEMIFRNRGPAMVADASRPVFVGE